MKQEQTGYMVAEGDTVEQLAEKVQNLMAQGWKVTGGIDCPKNFGVFQQALYLETPKPIKDYTIVDEEDPNKFVGEINLLLQNGWELQGGASVSHLVGEQHGMEYHGHRFVQAVVKY